MTMTAAEYAAMMANTSLTPQQKEMMAAMSLLTKAQIEAVIPGQPCYRLSGDGAKILSPATQLSNGNFRCDLGDGATFSSQTNLELHLINTHKS